MDLIIAGVILVGAVIGLIVASKNRSKFGINLKRVYCPVCNAKQPIIRMPKNSDQFLYGGTTCLGCGANLDKYGRLIP